MKNNLKWACRETIGLGIINLRPFLTFRNNWSHFYSQILKHGLSVRVNSIENDNVYILDIIGDNGMVAQYRAEPGEKIMPNYVPPGTFCGNIKIEEY